MKKTQRKDLWRNIWKQRVSFLSIIIIALLGVTAFLGIDFASTGLRKNGSALYNRLNFRDIEVVSTLLFSEEDLNDLKVLDGVVDVEPVCLTTADATLNTASEHIQVISLTQRINQPEVREGRLPEAQTECALEESLAKKLGAKVGDRLTLLDSAGEKVQFLTGSEFVISGIVNHPDHTNSIVNEMPYVLTTRDAFDADELNGCFMKAEIQIDKPENSNRFSKKYEKSVAAVLEQIDALALTATARRDQQLMNGVEDPKAELEEGFAKLENGKATIRDTIKQAIQDHLPEDSTLPLFNWTSARQADVDDPNETAKYFWITDHLCLDLTRAPKDLIRSVLDANILSDKLQGALYKAVKSAQGVEDPIIPLNGDGSYDMAEIQETLINAVSGTEFTNGFQALADGCNEWDEAHEQYLAFQPCRWLSFDVKGNASFAQMSVGSENFSNLKFTFSLLFILVGSMVIFATVGKIVDEQRGLVGTTKALGFFTREIFAKYLFFGVFATAIGVFLGMLVARFAIEPFLLSNFNNYYCFNVSKPTFSLGPTVLAFVVGILLAVVSVWLACIRLLREPAVRLMQPKTPATKKIRARGGKHVLSLYSRLILLNIRSDLGRVIVTIFSIAGCCALVVIGLTLKSSVNGSVKKQYEDIVTYDYTVKYDPDTAVDGGKEFGDLLAEQQTESENVFYANATYRSPTLQIAEFLCGDIQEIEKYNLLNDWKTGKPIRSNDWGVLITRKIAETSNLNVGDEFELALGGTKAATVVVAGVFENYIGRSIVMSSEYYEKAFGESYRPNAYMVRLNGADGEKLAAALAEKAGYESLVDAEENKSVIETSMSMLNTIVLLFIFIAGVMAGVVQLNLTNMYVLQKKREMTIMRINGFSVKEVIGYILRETVFTTVLGILFGIVAGAGAAYSIVRTLEQSFLQLDRVPDAFAWLWAALITVGFTVIVNIIALRNVGKLKLTDVA